MISNPILHDIIKSELTHTATSAFDICKKIPNLKNSNLFKKNYWVFAETRQEQLNSRYYQADCVWFFNGQKNDNYYVVNEVKTGNYDISKIYDKYRTGQSGQIWVWGWKEINDSHVILPIYQRKVKLVDIEYLQPMLIRDVGEIYGGLMQ